MKYDLKSWADCICYLLENKNEAKKKSHLLHKHISEECSKEAFVEKVKKYVYETNCSTLSWNS